ncbi:hypothetical protein Ple7327_2651 [Pleurocapsa sp. PCC 7327]|nr:hypothetical protein Ple7327_2651 [Pleurocapsa sp. PCC 7327]
MTIATLNMTESKPPPPLNWRSIFDILYFLDNLLVGTSLSKNARDLPTVTVKNPPVQWLVSSYLPLLLYLSTCEHSHLGSE